MHRCNECDGHFCQPKTGPEYEELCPMCGSDNFESLIQCDCGEIVERDEFATTKDGEMICIRCAFDFVKELIDNGRL